MEPKRTPLNAAFLVLAITVAVLVAGCGTSQTVFLKHPVKGDTVKCGPYTVAGNLAAAAITAQNELRYCINDFQRQGYERIP